MNLPARFELLAAVAVGAVASMGLLAACSSSAVTSAPTVARAMAVAAAPASSDDALADATATLIATAGAAGAVLPAAAAPTDVATSTAATPTAGATESAASAPPVKMATYTVSNVPFTSAVPCGTKTCQVKLDVFVPIGPGPFQTVVLLRGGPSGMGGRSYLGTLAQMLAGEGLLVFNADYRDVHSEGGGYPQASTTSHARSGSRAPRRVATAATERG